MNLRRTQWLPTAVGMVILGAIVVYVPSAVGQTSNATQIEVKNFMFAPTQLTVKAGSTVTWTNKDDEPHTVVSDAGLFRSGALDTDDRFAHTFTVRGTYDYFCAVHPHMTGQIIVK